MATDVDVQFFSHLNGLTLSNNWGDMIRLLDTCLVNGLPLTAITSATIDAQGDINLTLFAAHNCLLFQIVELSGFAPSGFNGKYRVKGTPTTTTLILKADKTGQAVTTTGTAKLASLGYEIAFRDVNDVKRAYRAIDPTAAHPFIRVDESLSGEGGGTYTSTYAKSAMVGLIEDMAHIDDYADTSKLQLPLDTTDFTKNWKIVGTGASVVRGWSRWYWKRAQGVGGNGSDANEPYGDTNFSVVGDRDAFYFHRSLVGTTVAEKVVSGCGLFNSALASDVVPNWFLMSFLRNNAASESMPIAMNVTGVQPFTNQDFNPASKIFLPKYDVLIRISNHVNASGVLLNQRSGFENQAPASNLPSLEIPVIDDAGYLRGTMKHILFAAKNLGIDKATPLLADSSMYIGDSMRVGYYSSLNGGFLYYVGELE